MSGRRRITDEQVAEIRRAYTAREPVTSISRRMRISRTSVYEALRHASIAGPEPIDTALGATLDALNLTDRDRGARALALAYARRIDDATATAAAAADIDLTDASTPITRRVTALRQRVDAVTILDQLGPKLLAALEALGATPRAAAALTGKPGPGGQATAPPPQTALERLRAKRQHAAGG